MLVVELDEVLVVCAWTGMIEMRPTMADRDTAAMSRVADLLDAMLVFNLLFTSFQDGGPVLISEFPR
jgi:hypothetical protein